VATLAFHFNEVELYYNIKVYNDYINVSQVLFHKTLKNIDPAQ